MAIASGVSNVVLTPADIPGADLSEPFKSHTMPALRWWLLWLWGYSSRCHLITWKSMTCVYIGVGDTYKCPQTCTKFVTMADLIIVEAGL